MHFIIGMAANLNAKVQVDVNFEKDLPTYWETHSSVGRIYQFPEIVPFLSLQLAILTNKSHNQSHESGISLSINHSCTFHLVKLPHCQCLRR